ncbi:hypothetical protein [Streptomyces chartreusis]|uniref:hypothetical protein n=1 Tax=Streptomyces chartreusis TaxID=1969 RepID=UPI0036A83C1B
MPLRQNAALVLGCLPWICRFGRRRMVLMRVNDFHPAGFDTELRKVLDDVRAGRWRSMRGLLNAPQSSAQRTARSQVLASAAAQCDAVEAWGRESRDHQYRIMWARVLVQRALHVSRRSQRAEAVRLVEAARRACDLAATLVPHDPVPWVAWLALAQIDSPNLWERYPENQERCWEPGMPPGPWGLLREVERRDPYNREAWHRVLQAQFAYQSNVDKIVDFGRWASLAAPAGSAVNLLYLYTHVERFRRRKNQEETPRVHWRHSGFSVYTLRAVEEWFHQADTTSWSPLDLNHLAQALHHGGYPAREVFEAIGSCVTRTPWQDVAPDGRSWQEEFLQARLLRLRESGPPRT